MIEVELGCAVYGEGTVFPVKIARDAKVSALQEAIVNKKKDINDRFKVDPATLTLYVARKNGGSWLKDDCTVKTFLRGGVSTEYEEMRPMWKLDDDEYFGANFQPVPGYIHVLVELPYLPNKRLRVDIGPRIEKFEDVPQIKIQGVQYVTLPAAFLEKCGYRVENDLMLYRRREVRDLWDFVQNKVIAENARGYIVGPPGTGKSMSTLSFVASLDHNEWNVVWIHLTKTCFNSCLAMGTKEYWKIVKLSKFELPRVAGKKLFICLDGVNATPEHDRFVQRIFTKLDDKHDRLVVCSSMASLGKRNREDDKLARIQKFFMYSWVQDDYFEAIANQDFYEKIVSKLDATSATVNDDDGFEEGWSEEEKKKHAVYLKFFYAGGSCRFMFHYSTNEVKDILQEAINSVPNKSDLVKYCCGSFHTGSKNMLYGMQRNGLVPVSSHAASLCANKCSMDTLSQLMTQPPFTGWTPFRICAKASSDIIPRPSS